MSLLEETPEEQTLRCTLKKCTQLQREMGRSHEVVKLRIVHLL